MGGRAVMLVALALTGQGPAAATAISRTALPPTLVDDVQAEHPGVMLDFAYGDALPGRPDDPALHGRYLFAPGIAAASISLSSFDICGIAGSAQPDRPLPRLRRGLVIGATISAAFALLFGAVAAIDVSVRYGRVLRQRRAAAVCPPPAVASRPRRARQPVVVAAFELDGEVCQLIARRAEDLHQTASLPFGLRRLPPPFSPLFRFPEVALS